MDKNWIKVVIAGVFEVGWVVGLKHSATIVEWGLTLVAIFLSFYLMISASEKLPVGTVYAVFVGIGTTGTVILDALLFGQALSVAKVALIVVLLVGVVGLKLVTPTDKSEVKS